VAGPLTAKLHCPVAVQVHGTSRVPVIADRRCSINVIDTVYTQHRYSTCLCSTYWLIKRVPHLFLWWRR